MTKFSKRIWFKTVIGLAFAGVSAVGLSVGLTSCHSNVQKQPPLIPFTPNNTVNAKTTLTDVQSTLAAFGHIRSNAQKEREVTVTRILTLLQLSSADAEVKLVPSLTLVSFSVTLINKDLVFDESIANAIANHQITGLTYRLNTLDFHIPMSNTTGTDNINFSTQSLQTLLSAINGIQNQQSYNALLTNQNNSNYYQMLDLEPTNADLVFSAGQPDNQTQTVNVQISLLNGLTFNVDSIANKFNNLPSPYNNIQYQFNNTSNVLTIQNVLTVCSQQ